MTLEAVLERMEHVCAERDALYDALRRVVELHKGNEFLWHGEQAALRNARALLAEMKPTEER